MQKEMTKRELRRFIKITKYLSTKEIELDIEDSEKEIKKYQEELKYLDPKIRLDQMRKRNLRNEITQRMEFIDKLRILLAHRGENG